MKLKTAGFSVLVTLLTIGPASTPLLAQGGQDNQLLHVRETVWRAWFANDTKALHALVPPETIVISGGEKKWKHQADIFQTAAGFQSSGAQLIRLEFPDTEL